MNSWWKNWQYLLLQNQTTDTTEQGHRNCRWCRGAISPPPSFCVERRRRGGRGVCGHLTVKVESFLLYFGIFWICQGVPLKWVKLPKLYRNSPKVQILFPQLHLVSLEMSAYNPVSTHNAPPPPYFGWNRRQTFSFKRHWITTIFTHWYNEGIWLLKFISL